MNMDPIRVALRLGRGAGALCVGAVLACGAAHGEGATIGGIPRDTLLLSVAVSGHAVIAAGADGALFQSRDDGRHFAPVQAPVETTFTRVIATADGYAAIGFDGVVARGGADGAAWRVLARDAARDNPWFGVAEAGGRLFTVGAFGRAMAGGEGAWQPVTMPENEDGRHLNALARVDTHWLVAGEDAYVAISDDAGANWRRVKPPVQGSLFGAVGLSATDWLVFGLRGHLLRTRDGGASWTAIDSHVSGELLGGARLRDGRVAIVGTRGAVLVFDPATNGARAVEGAGRASLADCAETADGRVLAAGTSGLVELHLPTRLAAAP